MNKLELTIWYTQYIRKLRDKYLPHGVYMDNNLDGFTSTSKIESIYNEKLSDNKYIVTGLHRQTWEPYSYTPTSPRDEGWSTRPCNKLIEVVGYFPTFLFDNISFDELKLKVRELFTARLNKAFASEAKEARETAKRYLAEADKYLSLAVVEVDIED